MRRRFVISFILIVIVIVAFMASFVLSVNPVIQSFENLGSSMEPGLRDGDRVVVNKLASPGRGDLVVFRYPADRSRLMIKRVVGVPGDSVEIVHGQLTVNGRPIKEDYLERGTYDMTTEKRVVPEGNYFVLGDNRNSSSDSRAWGYVPGDNVIGTIILHY